MWWYKIKERKKNPKWGAFVMVFLTCNASDRNQNDYIWSICGLASGKNKQTLFISSDGLFFLRVLSAVAARMSIFPADCRELGACAAVDTSFCHLLSWCEVTHRIHAGAPPRLKNTFIVLLQLTALAMVM